MSGSTSATIGCRTASSLLAAISSITAATPGTGSSINPGPSCPSAFGNETTGSIARLGTSNHLTFDIDHSAYLAHLQLQVCSRHGSRSMAAFWVHRRFGHPRNTGAFHAMASFLVPAGDQGDGAILRTCFDGARNLSLHRVIVSLSASGQDVSDESCWDISPDQIMGAVRGFGPWPTVGPSSVAVAN